MTRSLTPPSILQAAWDLFVIVTTRFRPLPRVWAWWLMAINAAGVLFLSHVEAQVLLASLVVGIAWMIWLYRRLGYVRALGTGHFTWFIVLPWLAARTEWGATTPFALWSMAVVVTNAGSLVIDVLDFARYLRGEREPFYTASPQ